MTMAIPRAPVVTAKLSASSAAVCIARCRWPAPESPAPGQAAVDRHVGQPTDEHRERVGRVPTDERPQRREGADVGQGAEHADAGEAEQLGRGRLDLGRGRRCVGAAVAQHAPHATQVVSDRAPDIDPGVRIVDPVDRHLVDPQSGPLADDQQLGVEEPLVVFDQWEQTLGHLASQGLEATLGVGEATPQRQVDERVVAPRDDLADRAADHAGTRGEAGPDGDVAVARDERRHQRQERVQPGGQVDIEIGDHRCVARQPRGAQRSPATLLVEVDGSNARQGVGQGGGLLPGAVGARVVGDRDPGRERELAVHEVVERVHAGVELLRPRCRPGRRCRRRGVVGDEPGWAGEFDDGSWRP